jgi:hypothetical protein
MILREISKKVKDSFANFFAEGAKNEKEIGGYMEIDETNVHLLEKCGEGKNHECQFDIFYENMFHTHLPSKMTPLKKNPPSANDFVHALSWGGINNELNPKFRLRTMFDAVADEEGIWLIGKNDEILDILNGQPSKEDKRKLLDAVALSTTVFTVLYASGKISRENYIQFVSVLNMKEMKKKLLDTKNVNFLNYLKEQQQKHEWAFDIDTVLEWEKNANIVWPVRCFEIQFEEWNDEQRNVIAESL